MPRLLIICLLFIFLACDKPNNQSKSSAKPAGNPILKDYAKNPIDKAKLADKMNDRHNRKMAEQIDQLDQ